MKWHFDHVQAIGNSGDEKLNAAIQNNQSRQDFNEPTILVIVTKD